MSVNLVFGENLRRLCSTRPSIASVARDLGIGKVQFHRYLKSESFPKPSELKRICDYFDVSASIYTTQYSKQDMLESIIDTQARDGRNAKGMIEAVRFAGSTQNYFQDSQNLEDGLYSFVHRSFIFPGKFAAKLLSISSLENSRVVRGLDAKLIYPESSPAIEREYRGVLLKAADGFSIVMYHNPPSEILSFMHITPLSSVGGEKAFVGYFCLGEARQTWRSNFTEAYLRKINGGFTEALSYKRKGPYFEKEDLPFNAKQFFGDKAGDSEV